MFERTDPKTLLKWLVVAGLVYFLLPYDFLPDFLGFPGRIDDVLMIAWLAWFYRNHVRQYIATGSGPASRSAGEDTGRGASPGTGQSKPFDAYEILGVARSASSDAIQAAYRAQMKQYHPDKVAHLGEALQKLALERSQEIQRAYQQLRG